MQRTWMQQLSWPDWCAGFLCSGHQAIQSVLHVATVSAGFQFADGQLIQLTVNSFTCQVCITNTHKARYKRDKALDECQEDFNTHSTS